jgi:enoyl-CoA hydratase/carnithine racemase
MRVAVAGGVAAVTIDHPPTNLVDGTFLQGLIQLLDAYEGDDDVRVLLLTSADPDFFLMHGDVRSILSVPTGSYVPAEKPNAAAVAFERLRTSRLVSIGVVDGAARGGGAEFLTALDLRYGSPRAVFGQPEVPMGILPGAGGTARLPRLLGRSKALEIILTGRDVPASEALSIGWLDAVVPSEELNAYAAAVARRIASMPPPSVAAVKRVVDTSLGTITGALTAETDALGQLMAAGGHRVPMERFLSAGGQTRQGETGGMSGLIDAMLRPVDGALSSRRGSASA